MSKYQFHASDIYLPGTEIPVNRLGIDDAELLQAVEGELLEQAYGIFVRELQPETRFDEHYFRALHHRTFDSLYDWAGQYRNQDMLKGGSLFCRGAYIEREAHRIFSELEHENFLRGAGISLSSFADRLAYYQGELIALHPFYELNGRITRLFFDLIAIHNGYDPIDYGRSLQEDSEVGNNYIRASIECVQHADFQLLRQMILNGLTPTEG